MSFLLCESLLFQECCLPLKGLLSIISGRFFFLQNPVFRLISACERLHFGFSVFGGLSVLNPIFLVFRSVCLLSLMSCCGL